MPKEKTVAPTNETTVRKAKKVGRPRKAKESKLPPITQEQKDALEHWADGGMINESVAKSIPSRLIMLGIPFEERWGAIKRIRKEPPSRSFSTYEVAKIALILAERDGLEINKIEDSDPAESLYWKETKCIKSSISFLKEVEHQMVQVYEEFSDNELTYLALDVFELIRGMDGTSEILQVNYVADHLFYGRDAFTIRGQRLRERGKMLVELLKIATVDEIIFAGGARVKNFYKIPLAGFNEGEVDDWGYYPLPMPLSDKYLPDQIHMTCFGIVELMRFVHDHPHLLK